MLFYQALLSFLTKIYEALLQFLKVIFGSLKIIASLLPKIIARLYPLPLECHFINLNSPSFSRSLLPRSVEKRSMRLKLEIEIE